MVEQLERITQDEYEETFVSTLKNTQNTLYVLSENFGEYRMLRDSGKYHITYFKQGETLYYSKTKKTMGFKQDEQ